MNVANKVTVARILVGLVFLFVFWTVQSGLWPGEPSTGLWFSLILFLLVTLTDALDGWLARHRGRITVFGRFADTFADKIIVVGAMMLLTVIDDSRALLAPWMVLVIVTREFLVTHIRGWMESEGLNFQAEKPGKYKMGLQVVAIAGLLIHLASGASPPWFIWLLRAIIWTTVGLTIYSGWFYIRKAKALAIEHELSV